MSDNLVCPYCGHVNHDSEYYESPEETDIDIECGKCKKIFVYRYSLSVNFNVPAIVKPPIKEKAPTKELTSYEKQKCAIISFLLKGLRE